MINEVEIYDGFNDKASHAYKGETKRNKPMFKGGGIWYVYLVYGMHYMINVVTREKGYPGAVLIRGAGKYNGPGKLSKALSVSSDLNNKSISRKTGIWVEDCGEVVRENDIIQTSRIGVAYAGKYWSKKKLRLILKNRPPKTGKAILNQKKLDLTTLTSPGCCATLWPLYRFGMPNDFFWRWLFGHFGFGAVTNG